MSRRVSPSEADSSEFDLEPEAAPPEKAKLPPVLADAALRRMASGTRGERAPGDGRSGNERSADEGNDEGLAPPVATEEGGWSFAPTVRGTVDLGLDGKKRAAFADIDRLPSHAQSTSGGVIEALDAADVAKGHPHGGAVQVAVDEVARSNDAPLEGRATFSVAIDLRGKVHVALLDANTRVEGWRGLTAPIRGLLEKRFEEKAVPIPEGSKGLRVVVRVEAKQQFVDGGDPKKVGAFARATPGSIRATKTNIQVELPSVRVGYAGKACGVGLGLFPGGVVVSGGCRESTAIVRMVSSRIVEEQRL